MLSYSATSWCRPRARPLQIATHSPSSSTHGAKTKRRICRRAALDQNIINKVSLGEWLQNLQHFRPPQKPLVQFWQPNSLLYKRESSSPSQFSCNNGCAKFDWRNIINYPAALQPTRSVADATFKFRVANSMSVWNIILNFHHKGAVIPCKFNFSVPALFASSNKRTLLASSPHKLQALKVFFFQKWQKIILDHFINKV